MPAFHLAFPVHDIEETRRFYNKVLGCAIGRETERWIDFNFFGHQLSAHLCPQACEDGGVGTVDGDAVPVRHFGVALEWEPWEALIEILRANAIAFTLAPKIRFHGEPGEQGTFFIRDPSGNALEFKSFRNPDMLFAS